MKRNAPVKALAVLLCGVLLLSGTLLVLHADHACHPASCPVCMNLARDTDSFLCLMAAFAGMGLFLSLHRQSLYPSAENRYVPDWTLVRRKVKLQD